MAGGKKPEDRGIDNPLDWFRHKAELMRFLGMNTYGKDLLEFGACQHWDSAPYGGNKWVYHDAQMKGLQSPSLNWGDWEVHHGRPADDPANYSGMDGDMLVNFLALPALPSKRVPGAASDPDVVVRSIETPHGRYLAVVNTAMTPKKGVAVKVGGPSATALASGRHAPVKDGGVEMTLRPYQLVTLGVLD